MGRYPTRDPFCNKSSRDAIGEGLGSETRSEIVQSEENVENYSVPKSASISAENGKKKFKEVVRKYIIRGHS